MSSTSEHLTLIAPDISCSHCVATVKQTVGGLDGILHVEASEATKQIDVTFDPQRASIKQICVALDEAGYPVSS